MGKKSAFWSLAYLTGAIHLTLGAGVTWDTGPTIFSLAFGLQRILVWEISKDFEVDSKYCPGNCKFYNLPIIFA